MPIYTYKCVSCGLEFEDFSRVSKRLENKSCVNCGAVSERMVDADFGIIGKSNGSLYTQNEIDRAVGKAAEKKWEGYNQTWQEKYNKIQEERRSGQKIKEIPMQTEIDGKYRPLLNLGNKEERQKRREYSNALQQHRAERERKGLSQFDGPGL